MYQSGGGWADGTSRGHPQGSAEAAASHAGGSGVIGKNCAVFFGIPDIAPPWNPKGKIGNEAES